MGEQLVTPEASACQLWPGPGGGRPSPAEQREEVVRQSGGRGTSREAGPDRKSRHTKVRTPKRFDANDPFYVSLSRTSMTSGTL